MILNIDHLKSFFFISISESKGQDVKVPKDSGFGSTNGATDGNSIPAPSDGRPSFPSAGHTHEARGSLNIPTLDSVRGNLELHYEYQTSIPITVTDYLNSDDPCIEDSQASTRTSRAQVGTQTSAQTRENATQVGVAAVEAWVQTMTQTQESGTQVGAQTMETGTQTVVLSPPVTVVAVQESDQDNFHVVAVQENDQDDFHDLNQVPSISRRVHTALANAQSQAYDFLNVEFREMPDH